MNYNKSNLASIYSIYSLAQLFLFAFISPLDADNSVVVLDNVPEITSLKRTDSQAQLLGADFYLNQQLKISKYSDIIENVLVRVSGTASNMARKILITRYSDQIIGTKYYAETSIIEPVFNNNKAEAFVLSDGYGSDAAVVKHGGSLVCQIYCAEPKELSINSKLERVCILDRVYGNNWVEVYDFNGKLIEKEKISKRKFEDDEGFESPIFSGSGNQILIERGKSSLYVLDFIAHTSSKIRIPKRLIGKYSRARFNGESLEFEIRGADGQSKKYRNLDEVE